MIMTEMALKLSQPHSILGSGDLRSTGTRGTQREVPCVCFAFPGPRGEGGVLGMVCLGGCPGASGVLASGVGFHCLFAST